MAEIIRYENDEEFYALFIRVEGSRGTVLIFSEDNPHADALANEIADIIDGSGPVRPTAST